MLYKQPTVSRRNVKDLQITGVLPCLNLNFGEEEPSQTDKRTFLVIAHHCGEDFWIKQSLL